MAPMKLILATALMAIPLAIQTPTQADAQARRDDADAVYQGRMAGSLMPLRAIENGVVPQMRARGGNYIGAEFDGEQARYRLKFLRNGAVIWVDVDGRSGAIIGKAGE